ncbi:MAG: ATP-binding cassette domain-containing protein [Candidatus Thermoplasmatota archaeon]
MSETAIVARGLTKNFGKVEALRGLDLDVQRGRILVILGPNGAGKTTLVRILATLLRPDGGRATVAGFDVVKDAVALRAEIGLAGQYAAVDEHLTGRENLQLVARLYHLKRKNAKTRAAELLADVGLTEDADRVVKGYSGGMRRRLDLAAALIGDPQVLFLDEPTTGLDPPSRLAIWSKIAVLREAGKTIVLTTQYLEEADRLADRVVVVDHGRIIAEGTVSELKTQVGGDVVEITLEDAAHVKGVAAALKSRKPKVDVERRRIQVPAPKGAQSLAEVLGKIPVAARAKAEVALRRPTLDDVFLVLTGHVAEEAKPGNGQDAAAAKGARKGGAA